MPNRTVTGERTLRTPHCQHEVHGARSDSAKSGIRTDLVADGRLLEFPLLVIRSCWYNRRVSVCAREGMNVARPFWLWIGISTFAGASTGVAETTPAHKRHPSFVKEGSPSVPAGEAQS
jgi:hypothetical protein